MNIIRRLHLYLGCFFAPLFVFFLLSGVWQTIHLDWPKVEKGPSLLKMLSTIHTSEALKTTGLNSLSSASMKALVVTMAISLFGTVVFGVVMAFQFGHRATAVICLALGLAVPVGLALLTLLGAN